MNKKIFRAIILVAGVVLLSSLVIIMGCLYDYFGGVQESQLKDELELAAEAVEGSGTAYLEGLSSESYRLTWVAADGAVIYDTQNDAAGMENHADRQEIRRALQDGHGESIRYSSTLLEKTVYSARRLSDGTVLRISMRRATAGLLTLGMLQPILIVLAITLILSFLLAGRVSRRIVEPLDRLDLDRPLENDAYEELAPLLGRLHQQQQSIANQLRQLQRQRDEFAQITGSLKEGLVLLDAKGAVVSINPTACRLFGATSSCIGQDFLTVERSRELSRAIETAVAEGHSQVHSDRAGRSYQFDLSRIESGGAVLGTVLLAFDVTEQEMAERNRREFTANVSHELKTPLQSIIGSAELMENHLVKPEDMPRFVGHIKQEAERLVALIEDIIRLSQLDEGEQLPFDEVRLLELCEEVSVNLNDAAEAKHIRLSVSGEEVCVRGVRRLLYEAVFNLCDNAVKYDQEGGRVDVTLSSQGDSAEIRVADTGIGIPPEHQSRVFERFYRVDKSHSKASGGTGLGLSIVKHAVEYHHGHIDLESAPGKGTTVTLTLPKGRTTI